MDPKHILKALAVMYLEEHGGRVLLSKSIATDAYRKFPNMTISVLEDRFGQTQKISVFLEEP